MSINEQFLDLRQVADLLHYSYNYTRTIWPKLTKYGVNPIRPFGKGHPLFKKSEVLRMMDSFAVIRK